jgi:hypothetical protein
VFTNHFARLQKLAKLAKAVGYAKLNGVGGKSRPIYLDVGARGGLPEPWTVEEVIKVEVVPLNTIWDRYSSAPPHFVKIDVQGFEKEILLGMENLLGGVLCIELEASFLPFYVGQPSFQELFEFLHERGFDLVKIRPLGLYRGAILEFNAFLVRRDRHGDKPVALWKRINDVGDHKRTITLGY